MKENYLKQCLPVNISIIRKSSGQDKSQADNQKYVKGILITHNKSVSGLEV